MSHVLIVGHRGFVGTALLAKFHETGFSDYSYINSDLLKRDTLEEELLKIEDVSTVIFLVGSSENDFKELVKINLITLNNLIEILLRKGLKNIIFSSTGAVYGEPCSKKSFEADFLRPNTLYGLSKIFSENLLKFYFDVFKLNIYILRFPNIYGVGNRKGVIYNFLKSIKYQNKIFINGDGKEKRDFLYIDDAVKSIICVLKEVLIRRNVKAKFNIYNIGSGKVYSLIEVVSILKNKEFKFDVIFSQSQTQNNLKVLSLNTEKFSKKYNWNADFDLKKGIDKIIDLDFKFF